MLQIFTHFFSITFHPLLFFVLAFIGGIATQAILNASYIEMTIVLSVLVGICILFSKKSIPVALFLLSGFLCGALCYKKQIDDHEHFCKTFCNQTYDVIATVTDKQSIENSYQKEFLKLSIQELYNVKTQEQNHINTSCIAYCSTKMDTITIGDTVRFSNIFLKKSKNNAFVRHLLKEGNSISFFAKNIPTLVHRPKYSLQRTLFNEKIYLLTTIKNKMSFRCYTLFASLFLGNRTHNKKYLTTIKEQFKYWGLSHYLARSGLHLIIFLLLFTFLLRLIPFSRTLKSLILTTICFLYALFSWSSISFIRALLTYFFYCLYIFFNFQINTLHILSLITFIILMTNPLQLFFLDFQLSFGLTFALAFINHAKTNKAKIAQLLPK